MCSYLLVSGLLLYFCPPSIKVHVVILVVCVWQTSLYIYGITCALRALPTCTNGMITLNFVNRPKVSSMYVYYPFRIGISWIFVWFMLGKLYLLIN